MDAVNITFECSMFKNKLDTKPVYRGKPWPEIATGLMKHKERETKDGPLWSPAIYKGNAIRGNAGVDYLTAGVGDFDDGTDVETVKERLASYEYVIHSTYSHTEAHPKFRAILPFSVRVLAADWPDIKARIDEHLFGVENDQAVNDEARIYYTASCPRGAARFAEHHQGDLLDPYSLPAARKVIYAPTPSSPNGHGQQKVPLGKTALDFVANGAPLGEQRIRALAAARNYLSAGYGVEEAAAAIWRGLQASPQDANKGPWTFEHAKFIAHNLDESEAPPLPFVDHSISPRMELQRQNLGYVCSFPSAGVIVNVGRVKRTSDGVKAEVEIRCSIPGIPRDVTWGSLNFASITARNSLVKILNKRTEPAVLDWDGMLEDICRKVTAADREGEPFIRFDELQPKTKASWLIHNFLPRNQITTIFGEGGSGKSNFVLANALSVGTGLEFVPGYYPEAMGTVLYLDYETDEAEMKSREMALCVGKRFEGATNLIYRHCQRSLPDDIEETIHQCRENDVELVIVDSVAMATAGLGESGSDQNESIIKLYTALRLLNTTCVLIDHVSAADMEKKGPRKPYGSIYKMNLARMAFDLRSTSQSGMSPLHIAIHNLKRNDGPLLASVGLCVTFGSEFGADYSRYGVEAIGESELLKDMKGPERVMLSLAQGMKTVTELVAITDLKESNVYVILGRGEKNLTVFKEGSRYGLVSMRHKYG